MTTKCPQCGLLTDTDKVFVCRGCGYRFFVTDDPSWAREEVTYNIEIPTVEGLYPYLCYQFPACTGNEPLREFCRKVISLDKAFRAAKHLMEVTRGQYCDPSKVMIAIHQLQAAIKEVDDNRSTKQIQETGRGNAAGQNP